MSPATELELELEFENEGEYEFSNELEYELGLANELVNEFELEHEQQAEHEAFFNHLAAMADRSGRSQALRSIALAAAKSALKAQSRGQSWPVVEGEGEFGELELELESEYELELAYSPAKMAHYMAMMEHSGHAAAEAANEQEAAEHFLPLIGLAAKFVLPKLIGFAAKKAGGMAAKKIGGQLLRKVAPKLIRRAAPHMKRALGNVARTLYRNPTTRPLLSSLPRIARGTVYQLGRQMAAGKTVTPQQAVKTLAQQTARTLSNPKTLAQNYRRSKVFDRKYHQRARRTLGVPSGVPVRAANTQSSAAQPYPGGFVAPMGGMPNYGGVSATPGFGGCGCSCRPAPTCPTCGR